MPSNEFLFLRGAGGQELNVDASGKLMATDNPTASGFALSTGNTGRTVAVDGNGRMLVALVPGSGSSLPPSASATFGTAFYVVGSGYYKKGISAWEQETTA